MKILVADDDPLTLDAMCECLRAEGYFPLPAKNGAEALDCWQRESPDLLCLDIMMPGIDGYEVCRRVRAKDPVVPVLFLSAKNEEIDVVVGLELGADDFIRKPFTRREMMARIRAALRRSKAEPRDASSINVDGITIWPDRLSACRNDTEIELTPREAAILRVLHRCAGRPVARDTLINECWGIDYFPDSRTLDQHIAVLRKKVERDAANPKLIETVRGVGYRMRMA